MAQTMLTPGFDYGDYYVRSLLGKGAMAEVYHAIDRRSGKEVALKVLRPGFGGADARLRRFEREASAIAATEHRNVVAIYELGKHNRTPFIAMEYVEGATLRDVLDGGPIPLERALGLARQIADGLEAAHRCGIVHRDLKPENVMISWNGVVKILDFGLSKPISRCSSSDSSEQDTRDDLTLPGTILGTLEYMSPEQANGQSADLRADQFAFGAILYEMLTGNGAFRRESMARVLSAVIEGAPEPMSETVPETVRGIVDRALQKSPAARFPSMGELSVELEQAARAVRPKGGPWLAVAGIVVVVLAAALFI